MLLLLSSLFLQVALLTAAESLPYQQPLVETLPADGSAEWSFELQRDDFIEVRIEQQNVDLRAWLLDPTGERVAMIDRVVGILGTEVVHWVASRAGVWRLQLSAREEVGEGHYEIYWRSHRPARSEDLVLIEAERLEARARHLLSQNRREEAAGLSSQARQAREATFGEDALEVVPALLEQAAFLLQGRQGEQARRHLNRAIDIQRQAPGADPLQLAETLNRLALAHIQTRRYPEAAAALRESIRYQREVSGSERALAGSLNNLAIIYQRLQQLEDAESLLRDSLRIRQEILGEDHRDLAQSRLNLAVLERKRGRLAAAEQQAVRALEIWETTLEPAHPEILRALRLLAQIRWERKDWAEAVTTLSVALERTEELRGPVDSELPPLLVDRARALRQRGDQTQAKDDLMRARAIQENLAAQGQTSLGSTLRELAVQAGIEKEFQQAEELLRSSTRILAQNYGPGHPELAETLLELALVLRDQGGREEEALRALEIAGTIASRYPVGWPLYRAIMGLKAELQAARGNSRQALETLLHSERHRAAPWPIRGPEIWPRWEARERDWQILTLELLQESSSPGEVKTFQERFRRLAQWERQAEQLREWEEFLPDRLVAEFESREVAIHRFEGELREQVASTPVPLPSAPDATPALDLMGQKGDLFRDLVRARQRQRQIE